MLFKELRALEMPEDRFVVGSGLVPLGGLVFIGGPPKSYKSFLLLTMGLQMACGLPIFDASTTHSRIKTYKFPTKRPVKVLIVEQELGWIDDRERLIPMWNSLSPAQRELVDTNLCVHAAPFGMDTLIRLDSEESDRHRLEEVIEAHMPDILMIDPLSMFHRQNENSAQDMSLLMRNLAVIRNRFKLKATLISHHTSKPRHDEFSTIDGPDLLRGSSVLFASGDSYIMVSRLSGDRVRLDFTLRRHRPITSMIAAINEDNRMLEFQEWVSGGDRAGAGRPSK